MAQAKRPRKQKSLEATLWEAADKLRGNLETAEYKHVVLGLVFLKYVSDAFTTRRLALEQAVSDTGSDEEESDGANRKIAPHMQVIMRRCWQRV